MPDETVPAVEAPVAIETVTVSAAVPKESYELAMAIVKMVKASQAALADGFQPTQDLPVLLVEAVKEFPAAVGGIDKLGAEMKADKGKLLIALSVALDEVI